MAFVNCNESLNVAIYLVVNARSGQLEVLSSILGGVYCAFSTFGEGKHSSVSAKNMTVFKISNPNA